MLLCHWRWSFLKNNWNSYGIRPSTIFCYSFSFYQVWMETLNNLKKENVTSTWKFFHTFRFIDDLITINDKNFEKTIHIIFQAELELKKENQIKKSDNFQDLNINMQNPRFQIKLYNTRENFNFNIIRVRYKSYNIPHKMFPSVMSAERLRICN